MQPQGAEPLPLPELPFQKVGTDLCEWDKKIYLLVIDYYSRFIKIVQLFRVDIRKRTRMRSTIILWPYRSRKICGLQQRPLGVTNYSQTTS